MKRKPTHTDILFVLCGVALSILLAEVIARWTRVAPQITRIDIDKPWGSFVSSDNPILKYIPKPGAADGNRDGFHDYNYAEEKPSDVKRLIVLGDSIAYGFCNDHGALPISETFSKKLERLLNSNGQRNQVINLGVSGYDTLQEAEMLRTKGLSYNPDEILIAYCLNDAWDASAELEDFKGRALGLNKEVLSGSFDAASSIYSALFFHSDLFRWLAMRIKSTANSTSAGPNTAAVNRVREGFRKIQRLASGRKVTVVIFPLFDGFNPYQHLKDHEQPASAAHEFGFDVLDLLGPMTEASNGDAQMVQRPCNREHPNAFGHEIAANAIYQKIKSDFPTAN